MHFISDALPTLLLLWLAQLHGARTTNGTGNTADPSLPDTPFFVVWNHPSEKCANANIDLGFNKWGIVDNFNDRFIGEKISLFYSSYFGKWPYYKNHDTNQPVNGGMPQLGNLTEHLIEVKKLIESLIPNKNFDGLGVIDFEQWRALWKTNHSKLKIYKWKSKEMAEELYPEKDGWEQGRLDFNKYARLYFEETLKEAIKLRPRGKWGYYYYPHCWDSTCSSWTQEANDELGWLYRASKALYPTIYFSDESPPDFLKGFIEKRINEAIRVKAKFALQETVIAAYANTQTNPYNSFPESILQYAIGLPADMGVSAVVLWGKSADMRPSDVCGLLKEYVHSTLGPYVQKVTRFFEQCSRDKCSYHGRCVRKEYEADSLKHCGESGRTEHLKRDEEQKEKVAEGASGKNHTQHPTFNQKDYVCRCYIGWAGTTCESEH